MNERQRRVGFAPVSHSRNGYDYYEARMPADCPEGKYVAAECKRLVMRQGDWLRMIIRERMQSEVR